MPQGPAVSGRPPTARGKRRGGKGEVDEGPVEAYSGRYFTRRLQVAGKDLVVAEAPNPGSTGSEVWRVAEHLVCLLENEMAPELLVGKRFLELGCGCGILGLAMALISNGKADITVTDYDPIALEMAELNVKLNNLSHCVKVRKFGWGSGVTELVSDGPFDFVLGSDIIYHPHCLQKLQMTLGDLMVPGLTTILLAYEHRQPALEQRFFNDCQVKLNLQCDRIKRRYLDRRDDAQHMSVYQMKGLGPGTASSLRPMSAMPILQQKSNRPGSSSYRRPFSAASSTDKPAMTRSSVSEVRQVDYSHLNVSRQLAMNSPGSQR